MNVAVFTDQVATAIELCDQEALSTLFFAWMFDGGDPEQAALIATDALATSSHTAQLWWTGDCNCDGHLN
jgi:hypothetical protein